MLTPPPLPYGIALHRFRMLRTW